MQLINFGAPVSVTLSQSRKIKYKSQNLGPRILFAVYVFGGITSLGFIFLLRIRRELDSFPLDNLLLLLSICQIPILYFFYYVPWEKQGIERNRRNLCELRRHFICSTLPPLLILQCFLFTVSVACSIPELALGGNGALHTGVMIASTRTARYVPRAF